MKHTERELALEAALKDFFNAACAVGEALHVVQPFLALTIKHAGILGQIGALQENTKE